MDVYGKLLRCMRDNTSLKRATYFFAPTFVTKMTRTKKYDGRDRRETFVVTVGSPNYAERAFIKTALAAGEPFPIKKFQLKLWPKSRARRT